MTKQLTPEEVTQLLAELETAQARITELESSNAEAATEAKIAEVRAELDAEVADLKEQLGAKSDELEALTTKHNELVSFLEQAQADAEAEAQIEEVAEARAEVATKAGLFSPEYIAENKRRWAELDDDAFERQQAEWAHLAENRPQGAPAKTPPASTGLGSTDREAASHDNSGSSAMSTLRGFMTDGVDARR